MKKRLEDDVSAAAAYTASGSLVFVALAASDDRIWFR